MIVLGNGGHAKVCADVVRLMNLGEPQHRNFSLDQNFSCEWYVIGVGDMATRKALYGRLADRLHWLWHPSAIVSSDLRRGRGAQIMAGAIIQPGCKIGHNVLINTRASVDHDCTIGDHVHIAPGAILCGNVTVGEGAFIGAGAVVTEGKVVPPNSFCNAGTVNNWLGFRE